MGNYRRSLGLQPYNNDQSQVEFMRTYIGTTDYNGLLISASKRPTKGLTINANYTLSRATDNGLLNQNNAGFYHNSFFPGYERSASVFDRTHVMNLNWVYELPMGIASTSDTVSTGLSAVGSFQASRPRFLACRW